MTTEQLQTWYELGKWNPGDIKPVQVKKATDKTLLIDDGSRTGRRTNIVSEYATYYSTLDAAVRSARRRYEQAISNAQLTIERAQADLAKLAEQYPAEYEKK